MLIRRPALLESLEQRRLMAWSAAAQLVNQDDAASKYASIDGDGVTVAVIDTGIDYTLDELGGGIGANFKVKGGYDFYEDDADPMDETGHGTSVASIIAAEPYTVNGVTHQGVAPDAGLVALRVGTEDDIANADIEKALQWVIDNYAEYSIGVVNLSLGSGNYTDSDDDSILADEFATLRSLGIFTVAASGNSNDQQSGPISQDGVSYPAADPNVFAVGAVASNDVIATWSQRGDELDLLAPGVDITTLNRGGERVIQDGTSFSSPYVAGAAALLRQANPSLKSGDIGSILMASGKNNRDGDAESGNTTTLQFSRLDINAALSLAAQRTGRYATLASGKTFDTALDSQGVLHAAYFDAENGDLRYATRATNGKWSKSRIIDSEGVVGTQVSIAVDLTGKVGIGYFDGTNTAIKYASFNGVSWSTATVESAKHVGSSPSLAFDIDGNAYLGYYRRASGDLKLAALDRDSGTWSKRTIDGADADVGSTLSVDVGEAALRSGPFTVYDTTVAIGYSDSTNGDLKYARLDLDDQTATWYIAVVDNTSGVGSIDLNLHPGPTNAGLQAQIAYQDRSHADVKYAYRSNEWFVETVATSGAVGASVQLAFDASDNPIVSYYHNEDRAIYSSTRQGATDWTPQRAGNSSAPMCVASNERTGESFLSYLNRARTNVISSVLA